MIIIQTVAFAIAMLTPICFANSPLTWGQVTIVLSISFSSIYIGRQLLTQLKITHLVRTPFAFIIITGFSLLSVVELLLIHFIHLTPIQSFLIILFTMFALSVTNKKFSLLANIKLSKLDLKPMAFDITVLIIISALATIWCRDLITSLEKAHLTGIFYVWPDLFLHTSEIISLENYSLLNNQSLYLSGIKKSFYHFASYAMPSLYASAANQLALNAATAFWTPVGIILMGLGVYLLASTLGGKYVGLLTVIAVFLLPDASMYGLKIGFFGFHWLLQTSAGSGYAMSLIFLAIALFVIGVRESKFELVLWAIPVIILCAFFRVQLAAPALIMMGILANIAWKPSKNWYRPTLYVSVIILATVLIVIFEKIELAPHFLTGELSASKFFDAIHSKIASSKYAGSGLGQTYLFFLSHSPSLLNWAIGYFIFLISALGFLFPILFFWSINKLISSSDRIINSIPIVMLLAGFLIIVLLPIPSDGDYSNFGHRPFIIYYALSIIFIIYWMSIAYNQIKIHSQILTNLASVLGFIIICICITVPYKFGKGIQQPKGWSENITINPTPDGLFNATAFIREHSKINELVLSSDLAPWAATVTLTERPAFISREMLFSNFKGSLKQEFLKLKKEFDAFKFIKTPTELCRLAHENKVTWVLKFPNDFLMWPKEVLDLYAFKSDGFYVYNLSEKTCSKYYQVN